MKIAIRSALVGACAVIALSVPMSAMAQPSGVSTHVWTQNMHPLGEALSPVPFSGPGASVFNSDLAFWGQRAYQGTYNGFNVIDISDPENLVKLADINNCFPDSPTAGPSSGASQGDVVVWGSTASDAKKATMLVRADDGSSTGGFCDGVALPPSFEGLTIWDVRNDADPNMVAFFELPAGAHTLSLIPDAANGRVFITGNASGGENGFSLTEIPTDFVDDPNPARIVFHGVKTNNPADYGTSVPAIDPVTGYPNSGRSCHDVGIHVGAGYIGCSGGSGYALWNIDPNRAGFGTHPVNNMPAGITNPVLMRSANISAQTGHTASFTWDGEIFIFGSEPGGGSQANCQATGANTGSTDRNKSIRFFDTASGIELGRHVMPRPQSNTENCTVHNLNVVPLREHKGQDRYVLVHGSYQSGIGVVDFSDIRNPIGRITDPLMVSGGTQHANLTTKEIAYADPAPLIHPTNPTGIVLGGSWSAYWYDGLIFDTDIRRGVFSWNLSDSAVAGARKLGHLNPQTQEVVID